MQGRRGPQIDLLLALICCCICCPTPGEAFFSLSAISPTLERMATYGYSMFGYTPPTYGYEDDLELYEKGPIWDGHIPVKEIVSPIIDAIGGAYSSHDNYGLGDERVVKGYDNRLGLRVAVPYIGDFQVTREIGPGIFLDKLGPGKYPYSNLPTKGNKGHDGGYHDSYGGYDSHSKGYGTHTKGFLKKPLLKGLLTKGHPAKGSTIPENKGVYQSLQNYPWYNR